MARKKKSLREQMQQKTHRAKKREQKTHDELMDAVHATHEKIKAEGRRAAPAELKKIKKKINEAAEGGKYSYSHPIYDDITEAAYQGDTGMYGRALATRLEELLRKEGLDAELVYRTSPPEIDYRPHTGYHLDIEVSWTDD